MVTMAPRPFTVGLSASALVLSVMLAGCTPQPAEPEPTKDAPTPAATETAAPEPDPTEAPTSSTPVTAACDELVSLQAMYDFNPNFSLLGSWTPTAGTPAERATASQGLACRWQNDTSGDTIELSVASFDAGTLERMANDTYDSSTMVPTYGGEGYFSVAGGIGEAVVFEEQYWVVLRSSYFMEPGDAEYLMTTVLSALP